MTAAVSRLSGRDTASSTTPAVPTRDRLLDTAAAAFAERGYDAVSVTQVAARMGASQGTVFHYFPSKFALYLAVHRRNLALLAGRVQEASDRAAGSAPEVQLHAVCVAYARHVLDHREYHAAHRDLGDRRAHLPRTPDDRALLDQVDAPRTAIEDLVRGLVAAAPRALAAPPRLVTHTLLGAMDSLTTWPRTPGEDDADRAAVADQVVSSLLIR